MRNPGSLGSWCRCSLCPVQLALGLVSVLPNQSLQCTPVYAFSLSTAVQVQSLRLASCRVHFADDALQGYLVTVACVSRSKAEVGRLHVLVNNPVLVDMLQCC